MTSGDGEHSKEQRPLASLGAEELARQMVADPQGYFTRARAEAKREAKRYVAEQLRHAKPA